MLLMTLMQSVTGTLHSMYIHIWCPIRVCATLTFITLLNILLSVLNSGYARSLITQYRIGSLSGYVANDEAKKNDDGCLIS